MTSIQRLDIARLRNLTEVRLESAPGINLLHGSNGSGKTSLLEAIYMLGVGRSFRSSKLDSVIQDGATDCVIFAELASGVGIGLSKSRKATHLLKLQGNRQRNWSDVARQLPLQVINTDSFLLLEGSPAIRRKFLDWGVFHVEQNYLDNWRSAARCLANRNLLLKASVLDRAQLSAWDNELVRLAGSIDAARKDYFNRFLPEALGTIAGLIEIPGLEFSYQKGWPESRDYEEVLRSEQEKDRRYGATQYGPHRADIQVRVGKRPAAEVLSRGQQKLLVSALKIAQGQFLSKHSGVEGIYLVDDLPAELDLANRGRVCALLHDLGCQVFMSCVDIKELENKEISASISRKFHVEHGKISASE